MGVEQRFSGERKGLSARLAQEIQSADVRLKPYFIIAGCKKGWTEVATFTNPDGLSAETETLLAVIKQEVDRLDAQHDSECGAHHDMVGIIRRIDHQRRRDAQNEGDLLAQELNRQTGVYF